MYYYQTHDTIFIHFTKNETVYGNDGNEWFIFTKIGEKFQCNEKYNVMLDTKLTDGRLYQIEVYPILFNRKHKESDWVDYPNQPEYYIDSKFNVWSGKNIKRLGYIKLKVFPEYLARSHSKDTQRGARGVSLYNNGNATFHTTEQIKTNYLKSIKKETSMFTDKSKYIIGSIKPDGDISVSVTPITHYKESVARTEAERLAKIHPGKEFAILKVMNTVVSNNVTWN